MRVHNIQIDQFIRVLEEIKTKGAELVDFSIEMDPNIFNKQKLVVYPIISVDKNNNITSNSEIKNPEVSTENNTIFGLIDIDL